MESAPSSTATTRDQSSTSPACFPCLHYDVASGRPCALLSLPSELRIRIYEHALLPTSDLALLRTCSFINTEAQTTLYQRPLSFPSQADLFSWIHRSSTRNLRRVRCLQLRLTDVDLSPLLDRGLQHTGRSAWKLYQSELERLEHALRNLPNTAEWTVRLPRDSGSVFLRGLVSSFVKLLPHRLPLLQHLSLEDGTGAGGASMAQPNMRDWLALAQNLRLVPADSGSKRRGPMEDVTVVEVGAVIVRDPLMPRDGETHATRRSSRSRGPSCTPDLRKVASGRITRVSRPPRKLLRPDSKAV